MSHRWIYVQIFYEGCLSYLLEYEYCIPCSVGVIATTFSNIFCRSDYQTIDISVFLELFEPTSTSPRPPSPTPEECDCPTEGPIDGAGLVKPSFMLLYLIVLYII